MIFQWYLFVLLIAVGVLARATGQTYQIRSHGQTETYYTWGPVLMVIIPMIYLAATRADTIGDTYAYMVGFRDSSAALADIPAVMTEDGKDRGFSVFNILVKSLIGNNVEVYLGIIAAICLLCVAAIYKKYSCNFLMSMFLFIASSDYVQWTHNGIRQFFAVAMIFAATDWLLQKKYIRYLLVVLLASTIHGTAVLMIPMCFIVQGKPWNQRMLLFLGAVMVAISSSEEFRNMIAEIMESSQYASEVDQFLNTEGTNVLRVLVFSVPPLLSLVFRKRILYTDLPIINLSVNMSIASMGAYIASVVTSGIFVGRIPIYFSLYNYILLPWLVEHVFDKRSARFIYAVLIACYLYFYYYQIEVSWGL